MKKIDIKYLVLFTAIYGILSICYFMFITWDGLSVWMGINVGFAMIPWISIVYIHNRFIEKNMVVDWVLIVGLIFFIFFYPNSFYILTDFIHVDTRAFYFSEMYEGTTYLRHIDPYLMLSHIIISAIVGAYAGIQSLLYLEKIVVLKFNNKKAGTIMAICVLGLSSVGVYIGRFLRFFSWDILRPFKLLSEFFVSIDFFAIAFFIWFTLLELVIYYGYKFMVVKVEDLK